MTEKDDQIVWGAEAIGKVIERTPRQVYYLADRKMIPVTKIGDVLVSTRQKLLDDIAKRIAESAS